MKTIQDRFELDRFTSRQWATLLSPDTWLGHSVRDRFLKMSGSDVFSVATPNEVRSLFVERFPKYSKVPDSYIQCFLDADVKCISHALSALFAVENRDAKRFLPPILREEIGNGSVTFDHIGIEVFGKLEWYIELFDSAYSDLGIRETNTHIFPSIQVRRALQYDDELRDVRIARIYFSDGENKLNLEVFEASQCWKYIALRQATLFAHLERPPARTTLFSKIEEHALEPVGHVAFRVPNAQVVESIQSVLLAEAERAGTTHMRPYLDETAFNPSDRSTNTKFLMPTSLFSGTTIYSQIVEILSYES